MARNWLNARSFGNGQDSGDVSGWQDQTIFDPANFAGVAPIFLPVANQSHGIGTTTNGFASGGAASATSGATVEGAPGPGSAIAVTVAPADHDTASLLWGDKWNTTNLTYSFPTNSADYGTSQGTGAGQYNSADPFTGFSGLTANQKTYVRRALAMLSSFTGLTFTEITETTTTHADLRFANSSSTVNPTAHAYPIGDLSNGETADGRMWGDVWYGGTGQNPTLGNFDNGQSTMHEIGHALGLKHGQDNFSFGVMSAAHLDIEYSDMNYPNYVGSTEGFGTAGPGSSEQTYQMYDIAALQYLYGANYSKLNQNVTYTWSATTGEMSINGVGQGAPEKNAGGSVGNIFDTVWTAGAKSTYDLSNFNTNGTLDLRPGKGLLFSSAQRADLGYYGNSGPGVDYAQYNVYNTLDFGGDTSSEITNLIVGNGNNTIYGDNVFNTFTLGNGNDVVKLGTKGGTVVAGAGADQFYSTASARSHYKLGAGGYFISGGGYDELNLNALGGSATVKVDFSTGQVYDGSTLKAQFYGVAAITTAARATDVYDLGVGDQIYSANGVHIDGASAGAGQDYIQIDAGGGYVKPGNAKGADYVTVTGGNTLLDLGGLTGAGSLVVDLDHGYAYFAGSSGVVALGFSGVDQFQAGAGAEIFVGQNSGGTDTINFSNAFEIYYGGAVGNTIIGGGGDAYVMAGSGTDIIKESSSSLVAGKAVGISDFHVFDGVNGTYLDLPTAMASSTSFTDVSGGAFIATALAPGQYWEAYVSGVSASQVQAQTRFIL
ncbi:matrixin family metalloprotease [Rhodoblastus sp. 17X3]|uniref:matrixin family metalloprotease n=1 Tax=Rhodoblastus sp. 17X3 TaxID=3047026 RepID=UPI0024B6DC62|nr:matrixin family metalloprotease [Rhodoblastus sp. 17X3]MDI9847646.1 matrixin family metalloprotease [Rhodoblastus sp. 17X3]